MTLFCCSIPRSGLPAPLLCFLREPDYLRDHEQAIQASVRWCDRMFSDKSESITVWQ